MSEESTRPARPAATFWQKHRVKLILSVVIAVLFAWTLNRSGLPLIPPRSAFERVRIASVFEYVGLVMTWHTIWATRWRHLLAPMGGVPLRRIIAVSFIGFAAILLLPLRA